MVLFWLLLLAHLIADFSLQTKAIFLLKKGSSAGVFIHVAIYAVVNIIVLFPMLGSFNTWSGILFLAISHGIIDSVKLRLAKNANRDNLIYFLLDQLLHILSIAFTTIVLIEQPDVIASKNPFFENPQYAVFLSGLWTSVFAGTVFIHYVIQDFQRWQNKDPALTLAYPELKEKLIGYTERLFATLCFVVGGFFFLLSVIIFIPRMIYRFKQGQRGINIVEAIAGLLICLCGGFIATL